jgi:hypothetical protein
VVAISYKIVDWRGKIGSAVSNCAEPQAKTRGVVWHYAGPPTDLAAGRASVWEQLVGEYRYQITPGLYSPGFAVNGMMYHAAIWEDTVYLLRNPDAPLWHVKDGTLKTSWNYSAYSLHCPIGEGQTPSARTLQTFQEFTDDLLRGKVFGSEGLARNGRTRRDVRGHQEISSTACPGGPIMRFLYSYRSSSMGPVEPPKPPPVQVGAISLLAVGEQDVLTATAMRAEMAEVGIGGVAVLSKPEHILYASDVVYSSQPPGARVAVAVGGPAAREMTVEAKGVLGKYGRDESDIWDAVGETANDTKRKAADCLKELVRRNAVAVAAKSAADFLAATKYEKPTEPAKPPTKPPAPSGDAAVIDRYFGTNYGALILEEAERAGLHPAAACALVEQESNGRNIFGADWGQKGVDRVPFAHLPVTRERVEKLLAHVRAGGTSNGVGLTQLTWKGFLEEAEKLGGAHDPRNQLRVGFGLLASYFDRYGEPDGWGAFNAGESNRASVRGTYSASCMAKRDAWRGRLGKA